MPPAIELSRSGYRDAHLHLQDARLRSVLAHNPANENISAQLTNGTCPDDWESVSELQGRGGTAVLKAYGVHPWKVDGLPENWDRELSQYLDSGAISVGEIGLDHWIEKRDDRKQIEVFERQLELSRAKQLPPTIHCLRAWGLLLDILQGFSPLTNGFLVHGFGGSKEILFQLLDLGGFVSFSAYAAAPQRKRMRDAARACPMDRILVETDAPDMVPDASIARFPLRDNSGERLHHPQELETAYAWLATLHDTELTVFRDRVNDNFDKLFGTVTI